jgi:hypothetical protein
MSVEQEQEQSFGAWIPSRVLRAKNISSGSKLLYGFIHSLCKEEGYCWASNNYLSSLLTVKEQVVKRMLKSLTKEKFIFVVLFKHDDLKNYTVRRIYPFEGVLDYQTIDGIKISRHSEQTVINGIPPGYEKSTQGGVEKSTQGGVEKSTPISISNNKTSKRSGVPKKQELHDPAGEKKKDKAVSEIFFHWQSVFGKERSILRGVRKRKIEARLKDGFTVDQLKKAIDGVIRSDFHMGRDKKTDGKTYIDFKTIFRDEEQVEKFIEMADKRVLSKQRTSPPIDDPSTCKLCNKGIGPCPAHRSRSRKAETNGELSRV